MDNDEIVQQSVENFDDFSICQTSNIAIDNLDDELFVEEARIQSGKRYDNGYDIDGKQGGIYNENNPPPGKVCGGFLKGNFGIIWKDVEFHSCNVISQSNISKTENENEIENEVGYCVHCGYSLYHYSDQKCSKVGNPKHPVWKGSPPPSYADING